MRTRFVLVLLPVILFCAFLSSCQQPYHEKEERYVFVAFSTGLPYWQEAEAGLADSAKQMGVKAELTGPANFSPDEELKAFQQAVAQKPSGILLSASTPEIFRDSINGAVQQGIPVICVMPIPPNPIAFSSLARTTFALARRAVSAWVSC